MVAQKHTHRKERRLPLITVTAGWEDVVRGEARGALEEILPAYLQCTCWFGRKGVPILSTTIVESIAMPVHKQSAYITMVRVQYAEGESQLYTLPLAYATGREAKRLGETVAHAIIAQLRRVGAAHHDEGYLYDPMWSAPFAKALLNATAGRRRWGSVSKVEMTTPMALICKVLFPSISTFETPPNRETRLELLSPSEAHWSTTKSGGMWFSRV